MRTLFRILVIPKMAKLSIKLISTLLWVSTCVHFCLSDSEADAEALRRSSFSTSSIEYLNPYKSRGASLRGRPISNNQLRDAAPFPFRHLPKPEVLRPVTDSFFYDPQVPPRPIHLRRQRQQFQNVAHEQKPVVSSAFKKVPISNPVVQIKELPPRPIKQNHFQREPPQPFSRRTHPIITTSIEDGTIVRSQEISELPQTSPFPTSLPTNEPSSIPVESRINRPSNDDAHTGTAMSFAKFSQSGTNLFDHQIHPTSLSSRKQFPNIVPSDNGKPNSFIPASQRPEMPTTRSRIIMSREKQFPTSDASTAKVNIEIESATEFPSPSTTSSGSAFPSIILKEGSGVQITEKPPNFESNLSETIQRSRGSTPDTIAKLRLQGFNKLRQVKLVPSFPAVPDPTPAITSNRVREPRILSTATTTSKTTTVKQKTSTSSATPTTSLFSHLRERPASKQTLPSSSPTTRLTTTQSRSPPVKARQSLLRAITERLR